MDKYRRLLGIAVAEPQSELAVYASALFDSLGIDCRRCGDAYSAVGLLVAKSEARSIVAGDYELLGVDGGKLFEIAERNRARCVCLVDNELAFRRPGTLKAVEAGAIVIQELGQLEQVVSTLLEREVVKASRLSKADICGRIAAGDVGHQ